MQQPRVANPGRSSPKRRAQSPIYSVPHRRAIAENASNRLSERSVKLVSFDKIEPEKLRWLWPGRVPLGKITMLLGDPGVGKSGITLDIASRTSTNQPMPDLSLSHLEGPANVLLLSAEDGPADTIRPRLDALGADHRRIMMPIENRHFSIPSDVTLILEALRQQNAKLCVIDPLSAFLDASINSWNNQHIRRALTPLVDGAMDTGAAILIVDHLNKRSGVPAVHRGSGSIGINAAARSVLMACKHPQEPETFVLSSVKGNLASAPVSLAYRTETAVNGALKLEWLGECPYNADELATADFEATTGRKQKACEEWLRLRLSCSSALSKVVEREALEMGFSMRTLARARKQLGVISQPSGLRGEWVMSLPSRVFLGIHTSESAKSPHTQPGSD